MAVELRGLAYFESLQSLEGRKFSSLESAARLLSALGEPQNKIPALHVAGTNGKGSVCALLSAIIHAAGNHVGQTCSPHLVSVTERCLIDGAPVEEDSFSRTIDHVMSVAAEHDLAPSYFVLGLSASFVEFAARKLDWMVVEVGLGGLLDATNLIDRPKATLITSVSADHMELLGPTIADVALNKSGIAKPGVPMFVGAVSQEAREVIARVTTEKGAPVHFFGEDFFYDSARDEMEFQGRKLPAFIRNVKLEGKHQELNAVLAVRVAYELGLSEAAIANGLSRARWPGRLEWMELEKPSTKVLLDVGHNPEGMDALCAYLEKQQERRIVFVFSILARKDARQMIERTKLLANVKQVSWIFTDSGYPGAFSPEELRDFASDGEVVPNCEAALQHAAELAGEKGVVVVTGSVFLVGRLRSVLREEPLRTIAL